jgi:cytoskeleton protein RodZ
MDGEFQSGAASDALLCTLPGAALASSRMAHGLTVEQVASRLKLAVFQIKAIEANNFDVLPGAVFARGFVRNYARLFSLDAELLLAAMVQQHSSQTPPVDERLLRDVKGVVINAERFRGLLVAAVLIAGVVGALAFYEFALNDAATKPIVQVKSAPVHVAVAATESLNASAPLQNAGASTEDTQVNVGGAAGANAGLHFAFSRESWVEVRDRDGNILFSKVNLPGSEYRVQGIPPFNVIVGGAHGVQLAYNGNPIDLAAHAIEDVARLKVD